MCAVLSEYGVTIAPSTYYAHRARYGPSKTDWADAQVIDAIWRLRQSQSLYQVLGARKTWIVLRTNGIDVSRCVVERVMRKWDGAGVQAPPGTTTVADPAAHRAPDRVSRRFAAEAPDRIGWPISPTAAPVPAGPYTAFVTDVHARKIVGWKVATEMTQKLVTDAINHAIDTRKRSGTTSLESIYPPQRCGRPIYRRCVHRTVGRRRDRAVDRDRSAIAFDNALAESVNSSHKDRTHRPPTAPPRRHRALPGHAEWVAFYNRQRPNGYCRT